MKKTILFQGDSITDAGRTGGDPAGLGNGYPKLVAERLCDPNWDVVNRGVSGNRVRDLVNRWKEDCLVLRPDVLTILIGINNCWRKYDSNDETPIADFERDYVFLLDQVRANTEAKIILMEPFVLPYPDDRRTWRETLDPEIQTVRALAREYKTRLIPLDALFAKASLEYGCAALAADGVPPTELGHRLIADAWLEEFETLPR